MIGPEVVADEVRPLLVAGVDHARRRASRDVGEDVVDVALDGLGRDAVLGVIGELLLAPAVGLGERALHRAGDPVGVEDHPALDVARGAADGLDQRGLRAQEALLVGIEDRDQPAFGNVEPLAQQVDADQHVIDAEPQLADQLDALQRLDVRVHVADPEARLVQDTRSGPRPCAWSAW